LSGQALGVRKISAALLKVVNKLPNTLKPVRYAVGVNLMNDRREIADDHSQSGDVFGDDRKIELNFDSHSSSPVLSDNCTVRAAAGGVIPRASGGVARGGR